MRPKFFFTFAARFVIGATVFLGGCAFADQGGDSIQWVLQHRGFSSAQVAISYHGVKKNLLLFKIDPRLFHFRVYENKNTEKAFTIQQIHAKEKSLLTFNGSFFGDDFRPVGFVKSEGRMLHKLSKSHLLNGVFAIDADNRPKLFTATHEVPAYTVSQAGSLQEFKDNDRIGFALQSGPILLDENGDIQIFTDSGREASRTAIGLDQAGNVMVLLLKQSLLNSQNIVTLYEFAHLLKENESLRQLGLRAVLNLDGGSSSGVAFGNEYYPEMEKVQNVVMVHAI